MNKTYILPISRNLNELTKEVDYGWTQLELEPVFKKKVEKLGKWAQKAARLPWREVIEIRESGKRTSQFHLSLEQLEIAVLIGVSSALQRAAGRIWDKVIVPYLEGRIKLALKVKPAPAKKVAPAKKKTATGKITVSKKTKSSSSTAKQAAKKTPATRIKCG